MDVATTAEPWIERTDDEVLAMIRSRSDKFFDFVSGDLLQYLPEDKARAVPGFTIEEGWVQAPRDRAYIVTAMRAYMPFAWDQANNQRSLSAARSIQHMQAWLWMLGEDEAFEQLETYDRYGKPWLAALGDAFGFNWVSHDDGVWNNGYQDEGHVSDDYEDLELKHSYTS